MTHPRLTDPEEHFPYKRADALSALAAPPEVGTRNHPEHWYTSEDIIEATAAYVAAQEAFLRDPNSDTKSVYDQAGLDLVAARQAHRVGRTGIGVHAGGN